MQVTKSYAQAVKDATPPRKRQDSKPTPPKVLQQTINLYADDSDNEESFQVLDSGRVASEVQKNIVQTEKIKELNLQLLSRENAEELSIAEYMEAVRMLFGLDCTFLQDFMTLVDRDDICVNSEFLKKYGIQSQTNE